MAGRVGDGDILAPKSTGDAHWQECLLRGGCFLPPPAGHPALPTDPQPCPAVRCHQVRPEEELALSCTRGSLCPLPYHPVPGAWWAGARVMNQPACAGV